ncbi:unnamed protein product [Amoebophrya sp. A120]|nr:unnamed protein product [Amoebophrya sp. A120]|eukprot:GSA120T00011758001.1
MLSTLRSAGLRGASRQAGSAMRTGALTRLNAVLAPSSQNACSSCRNGCAACSSVARAFSSAAVKKLQTGLAQELQHEKDNYEKPAELSKVPAGWNFTEDAGNVNMKLEKTLAGDRVCKVEWQLVSPPMAYEDDPEYQEGETPEEPTEVELTVTVETKDGAEGLTYFCSTSSMEGAKEGPKTSLSIGNLKTWSSVEERDNAAAYNGPEFDDLDDRLQEAMEEYLAEIGVSEEVQEFVNASAADKEQREYMRWMENLNKFVKA